MENQNSAVQKKTPRNSSIELLRIIVMVMIVFAHFVYHGGLEFDSGTVTATRLWYNALRMGGKVGVDVFVLISGYFLVTSKGTLFNFKRILKLYGPVIFYSVGLYLLFSALGLCDFGLKALVKAVFPISFSMWWFTSAYFVLYLIHPFLNKLLQSIDKRTYQKLLVLLMICWSIIPTFTTSNYQGNSFIWFTCLYCIAGYIRLYGLNPKWTCKHYFIMWILSAIVSYSSTVVLSFLGTRWKIFGNYATYFYGQEKITTVLVSISLFMTFLNIKMAYHKWINVVASATFGVYLIHEHSVVRPFLWIDLFKNAQYQDSLMLIPYSIGVCLLVFAVCTLIDLIRQWTIEKPFLMLVDKFADKALKPFEMIIDLIKNIIFGKE